VTTGAHTSSSHTPEDLLDERCLRRLERSNDARPLEAWERYRAPGRCGGRLPRAARRLWQEDPSRPSRQARAAGWPATRRSTPSCRSISSRRPSMRSARTARACRGSPDATETSHPSPHARGSGWLRRARASPCEGCPPKPANAV